MAFLNWNILRPSIRPRPWRWASLGAVAASVHAAGLALGLILLHPGVRPGPESRALAGPASLNLHLIEGRRVFVPETAAYRGGEHPAGPPPEALPWGDAPPLAQRTLAAAPARYAPGCVRSRIRVTLPSGKAWAAPRRASSEKVPNGSSAREASRIAEAVAAAAAPLKVGGNGPRVIRVTERDAGTRSAKSHPAATVPFGGPPSARSGLHLHGKPRYPRACRRGERPCEGESLWWVVSAKAGERPRRVEMLRSAGCPKLDASARKFLRASKFPAKGVFTVRLRFRIE